MELAGGISMGSEDFWCGSEGARSILFVHVSPFDMENFAKSQLEHILWAFLQGSLYSPCFYTIPTMPVGGFQTQSYPCPQCPRAFTTGGGLTRHVNSEHRVVTPIPDDSDDEDSDRSYTYIRHPHLNGMIFALSLNCG